MTWEHRELEHCELERGGNNVILEQREFVWINTMIE